MIYFKLPDHGDSVYSLDVKNITEAKKHLSLIGYELFLNDIVFLDVVPFEILGPKKFNIWDELSLESKKIATDVLGFDNSISKLEAEAYGLLGKPYDYYIKYSYVHGFYINKKELYDLLIYYFQIEDDELFRMKVYKTDTCKLLNISYIFNIQIDDEKPFLKKFSEDDFV